MLIAQQTPELLAVIAAASAQHVASAASDTAAAAPCSTIPPAASDAATLQATANFQIRNAMLTAAAEQGRTAFIDHLAGHGIAATAQQVQDVINALKF